MQLLLSWNDADAARRRLLRQQMKKAQTYKQWSVAATKLDQLEEEIQRAWCLGRDAKVVCTTGVGSRGRVAVGCGCRRHRVSLNHTCRELLKQRLEHLRNVRATATSAR